MFNKDINYFFGNHLLNLLIIDNLFEKRTFIDSVVAESKEGVKILVPPRRFQIKGGSVKDSLWFVRSKQSSVKRENPCSNTECMGCCTRGPLEDLILKY